MVDDIKKAIDLKANSKLLQQKIQLSTGKKLTLKDIANLRQYSKASLSSNDLEDIAEFLKQREGTSVVDICVDGDKSFKGLFYQDYQMQRMFQQFPEILLVDSTYKLLELRLPVYLLLGIAGNGQSKIIALFIISDETKESVCKIVECVYIFTDFCY